MKLILYNILQGIYRSRSFCCRVVKSTSTLTAYLMQKITTRFRVISNGGGQIPQPGGQARGRQAGRPGNQPTRQAASQAARQASSKQAARQASRQGGNQPGSQATSQAACKQARRQADALQGDLGQFLRLGKNPYAWQHIWGKTYFSCFDTL